MMVTNRVDSLLCIAFSPYVSWDWAADKYFIVHTCSRLASLMIYPLLFGVVLFGRTGANLVNITIDDRFGDPSSGRSISYFPSQVWRDGATCPNCAARPDADNLFKKSWTDATFFPTEAPGLTNVKFANVTLSATIFFNGSAIFVNCVLAHTSKNLAGDSDLSFYIDGRLAGTFFKRAPGSPAYEYNVTVFSETDLPPGEHNLTIQNGHVNGITSLILLDSIVYTQDDGQFEAETTSPMLPRPTASVSNAAASAIGSNPSFIAPIVIAGVSGIILLTIVGMLLYNRWRRGRGRNRVDEAPEPTPLVYGHAHVNFPTRASSPLSNYTISDMPPTHGEQSCSDYSRSPIDQKEFPSLPAVGYLGLSI